MTKLWRFFMISMPLIVVMLLSLTKVVGAAPITQSGNSFSNKASALTCNSWCVVPSPNASTANNFLRGVAVVSSSNAWAVGYYTNHYNNTLIEHYNGTSWKVFPSPSPGNADNRLFGVVALSANNIWAVGTYDIMYQPAQTLVEHFNGTNWTVVKSPSPNSFDVDLYSVAAASANDIWAVGYYATSNTTTSIVIEHYDGISWKIVHNPSPGSAYNDLRSVTAVSSGNIWAVGIYNNIGTPYDTPPQTLIEHYDGTSWKIFASPSPGSANNQLYGVTAVSASNIWAVGMQIASNGPSQSLVEHFNGTSWTVVPSPNSGLAGSYSALSGIVAVSANNIWAVGNVGIISSGAGVPADSPSNATTQEPTLIEHYNGKSWQIVSSPSPGANANVLEAAARVPGTTQVWTVGYEFMTYGPNEAAQTLIEFHS